MAEATTPGNSKDRLQPEYFPATSAVLMAAAFMIDAKCKDANDKYMLCKEAKFEPADCIEAGENVHECVHDL